MRFAPFLVALTLPALAMATGFGGNDAPSRIPVPARVFSATLEDNSGSIVKLNKFTLGGEVFLYGKVGEGQVAVHFEKLVEIRIEPTEQDKKRVAFAHLKDGESIRVIVDDDVPAYGVTNYGNYRIDLRNVRKIVVDSHNADNGS